MFSLLVLCIGLGVAVEGNHKIYIHPQTAYCTASFVVKVTVRSEVTMPTLTTTTTQSYKQFNIVIDHVYKGQTFVDKLTNKRLLYFTTSGFDAYYPEVGKSYIMAGKVFEGKFYAAEYDILETITDSVEAKFLKLTKAYDCSCGIDLGFNPTTTTTTTTMCSMPSSCQSFAYCAKLNGKCTWKCL